MADSEDDQEIIESCFQISTQHTEIQKSALCYISGYGAFTEGCSVSAPNIPNDNSKFLDRVPRGRLGHPPTELFDLSQYLYTLLTTIKKICCPQVFLDAYRFMNDQVLSFRMYIPNSGDSTTVLSKHLQNTSVAS